MNDRQCPYCQNNELVFIKLTIEGRVFQCENCHAFSLAEAGK